MSIKIYQINDNGEISHVASYDKSIGKQMALTCYYYQFMTKLKSFNTWQYGSKAFPFIGQQMKHKDDYYINVGENSVVFTR